MSRLRSVLIRALIPALVILFVAEASIMFLMDAWNLDATTAAFLDAGLMLGLSAPFLHYLVFRPLLRRLRVDRVLSTRLFERAVDGLIVTDEHGIIQSTNAAAAALFGYTRSELEGNHLGMLQAPKDQALHKQGVESYLRTGQKRVIGFHTVVRGRHKGGTFVTIELSVSEIESRSPRAFLGVLRDVTQREREERAMRLSNRGLESSGHAVLLLTRDGKVSDGNQRACDLVGTTREELLRKTAGDLGLDCFGDAWEEQWKQARRSGRFVRETQHRRQDGKTTPVAVEVSRFEFEDQSHFFVLVRDLKAEHALLRSQLANEAKYQTLFDCSRDAIMVLDPQQGAFVAGNPATVQMFACADEAEFVTKTPWDLSPEFQPDGRPSPDAAAERIAEALQTGSAFFEWTHQRAGGEVFPANVLLTRVGWQAKVRLLATVRDTTEQKRAEEQSMRLTTAIEQAFDAVMITDTDGTIRYVNPAFERITGYSAGEVEGQNPRLLSSGLHDVAFYREMWTTIKRGDVWTGRMTNRRKDGSLYPELASISPVRDARGRPFEFVAVKRDITQEVALEEQLRQSQKLESLGSLVGGVAHDFNNLLTVMQGFGELLHDRVRDDPGAVADLDQILKSARSAIDLTGQLLTFSRQKVSRPCVVDLNTVVAEAEGLLRRLAPKSVELTVNLELTLGAVMCNAGNVEQVLMNLCINACDAMPQGGRVLIETANVELDRAHAARHPDAEPGPHVALSVKDTGCGIDSQALTRIFDPFFTTKDLKRGTGLGLSTVYGIVKQWGGHIEVQSEVGSGSVFRIFWPRTDSPAGERGDRSVETSPQAESAKILLVEDEEAVLALQSRILAARGFEVLEAGGVEGALNTFRSTPDAIDLLVTDVMMPGGTGPELVRRLRMEGCSTPVLYVSGYSQESLFDEHDPCGDVYFLPKPFTAEKLADKVHAVLDEQQRSGISDQSLHGVNSSLHGALADSERAGGLEADCDRQGTDGPRSRGNG